MYVLLIYFLHHAILRYLLILYFSVGRAGTMTATMSTESACPRIRTTTITVTIRRRRHPAAPAITLAAAVRRKDTAPPPPAITISTPATQRDPADAARRSFLQPVVAERQRRFAAVPAAQGRHILCDTAAMAVAAT
jgi:hypothetical protein